MKADELEECLSFEEESKKKSFNTATQSLREVLCEARIVNAIREIHTEWHGARLNITSVENLLKMMLMNEGIESYQIFQEQFIIDVKHLSGNLRRFWYHPSMSSIMIGKDSE